MPRGLPPIWTSSLREKGKRLVADEEAREEERAEEIIARIHLTESGALDEDPVASLIDRVGEMKRGLGEIEIELGTLSRTGTGDRDTDT